MPLPPLLPPADWARLRSLLDEALRLPPQERERWMAALPDEDSALRDRLRSLLESDSAVLSTVMPRVETSDFAAKVEAPTQVGPYRLLRELGHGGMASVWLAERTDVLQQRQVALKLPHGAWRRSDFAARLAREREILATLEHPHIARLYDAGVGSDGQPWLAIEYVQGEPIDRFAGRWPLAETLRLFVQVVRAVAYAHGALVVHRDLKPANILVDAQGQVKLLDFGIAKLLDDGVAEATELTRQAGGPYTPQYASPEQLRGEPLGTASDIFSLGVLLYELLSGQHPFASAGIGRSALEHAVQHTEPKAPSQCVTDRARARALQGDLDTIVLKALKKETRERYGTAAALADDIECHLAQQPVQARPDSFGYRLQRLVRRNRVIVVAAAMVTLSVLGGLAAALWQARLATEQRDLALAAKARADHEAGLARRAQRVAQAQSSLSDFLLSDAAAGMSNDAAAAQIERSLVMIRTQYRDDDALRGELLADAAVRLRWIGLDQPAQKLFAEAEPLLRATASHEGMARLLCVRARDLAQQGRYDDSRRALAEASEELQRSGDPSSYGHAGCLLEEAAVSRLAGDPGRAVTLTEKALAHERAAGRGEREFAAEALRSLARARLDAGQYAKAAEAGRESLALRERLGLPVGPGLWQTWTLLGMVLRDGGQPEAALRAFSGDGRIDPTGPEQAPSTLTHYALTLQSQGRLDEAMHVMTRARAAVAGRGSAGEQRNTVTQLALIQIQRGQLDTARQLLDEVEPRYADLRRERRPAARHFVSARAQLALAEGRLDQAAASIDELQGILDTHKLADMARRGWHRLSAQLAQQQGRWPEALQAAQAALALSSQFAIDPAASIHVAEDRWLLAQLLHQQPGPPSAREEEANAALAQAEAAGGPTHPLAHRARAMLAGKGAAPPQR